MLHCIALHCTLGCLHVLSEHSPRSESYQYLNDTMSSRIIEIPDAALHCIAPSGVSMFSLDIHQGLDLIRIWNSFIFESQYLQMSLTFLNRSTFSTNTNTQMQSTNILQFNAINPHQYMQSIHTNIYVNTNIHVEISTPIYSAANLYLLNQYTCRDINTNIFCC